MNYTTVEVGPGLFIVCWKEPEQGTSVTHFQDWNKLEVLASVASGHPSGHQVRERPGTARLP